MSANFGRYIFVRKACQQPTEVLLQAGLNVETIGSAYPGFGFGGRNSTGH
ncbi:MAG: hypothetical protein ABJB86_10430 [Bacteroidota bacterium]